MAGILAEFSDEPRAAMGMEGPVQLRGRRDSFRHGRDLRSLRSE